MNLQFLHHVFLFSLVSRQFALSFSCADDGNSKMVPDGQQTVKCWPHSVREYGHEDNYLIKTRLWEI